MLINECTQTAERWDVYELVLTGTESGNSFTDVRLKGIFTYKGRTVTSHGFYDGNGSCKIRFMPDMPGTWAYISL